MMASLFRTTIWALLALLVSVVPAHAQQLYKWTDANGRVQYSDRKPTGNQASEVRNTVSSIGSQQYGGKNAAELNKDYQKRQEQQSEAQKKQQQVASDSKQKSENCDAARRNLAALQSGQRIARFDAQGEKSYMDDATRVREESRMQQQVESNCN